MAVVEQQESIVLRALRYGEADVIVHLFTLEAGRRNAIGKGVRKPSSRLGGRLEPLTVLRLQLRRGRGDLAIVQAVELLDAHEPLRASYRLQQVAAVAMDMLNRLSVEHAANEPAFHLACNFLRLLEQVDQRERLDALLLAFQLKLLHVTGFGPQLNACTRCGAHDDLDAWSSPDGGTVCAACRQPGDAALPAGVHATAAWAMQRPLADVAGADEVPSPGELQAVARTVVAGMCGEHAGFRPKVP